VTTGTATTSSLERLATLRAGAFVAAVSPWFEAAPGFLWRLAAARPFPTPESLFERAREIALAMPEPLQVDLVDAHPRLGAPRGSVSPMSYREQGYDREAAANLAEAAAFADEAAGAGEAARERARVAAELDRLNREYEARFGFRYCVFVAGRSRAELLPDMAAALERERESELHRALDAVVDIAESRSRG
jgi:2-oxo-4-hydroxy-4-carboxy--5-ureidoimidazoline (OHCU) decarboxylase